nr:ATP-binding protein [Acidobacteriota bacterium]
EHGELPFSRREARRVLAVTGAIVALALAAGLAWMWYSNRARLDDSQEIRAARTVRLFEILTRRQVQSGRSLMRAIVESRAVQEALEERDAARTIAALHALRDDFGSLLVAIHGMDGRPIAWSTPAAVMLLGSAAPPKADEGPTTRAEVIGGNLTVILAQPVSVQGRAIGGVRVAVLLGRSFLEQTTQDLEAPLAVFKGATLAHSTFPRPAPPPPDAERAPETGEIRLDRATLGSESFDIAYTSPGGLGGSTWLAAGMPRRADESRLLRFVLANAALAAAALALVLLSLAAYLRNAEQRQRLALQRDAAVQRSEGLSDRVAHLAAVVHDIKAPVSGIQLRCEGLIEDAPDPQVRGALDQIVDTCERLNIYLANVLTAAQAEEGPIRPHLATLLVPGLVEDSAERVGPLAARRQVTLRTEIEDGLPPLMGDAVFLERALVNLASNAVAATAAGGAVTLFARREGDRLALGTRDSGRGFVDFDPGEAFSRERPQVKDASLRSGTGLGLYIVARIAEAHGGTAVAENRPEGGAEVRLVLPLARPAQG